MTTAYLLDVNVLVAMAWPSHRNHALVQGWLARHANDGWATCPFTQLAFVRIISNPAFSRDALPIKQAVALLESNLKHSAHQFWPANLSLHDAFANVRELTGHQQVADAYLLALCLAQKGTLVTLDKSIAALAKHLPGKPLVVIG